MAGALPPLHEIAKTAGIELPGFMGKASEAQPQSSTEQESSSDDELSS